MSNRDDLQDWVVTALKANAGNADILTVAQHIWANHEEELRASGELFYTWQYDMRWACTKLRNRKLIQPAENSKRGEWRLA